MDYLKIFKKIVAHTWTYEALPCARTWKKTLILENKKCKTNFNKETGFSFKALYEIGSNMAYSTHNCSRFNKNLVSQTGIFGTEFMFRPGVTYEFGWVDHCTYENRHAKRLFLSGNRDLDSEMFGQFIWTNSVKKGL